MHSWIVARSSFVGLGVLLGLCAGCYHYRVSPTHVAPATEPRTEVLWSFAWGAVQQWIEPENCPQVGLAEVTVSTHFGFTLLTVLSLGFVAPATVTWRCAKRAPPADDGLGIGPTK